MVFEAIGPIISIYRLFTDGLKVLLRQGRVRQERRVKRWLIELQIKLENLIDQSDDLVKTLRKYQDRKKLGAKDIDHLQTKLRSVGALTMSFWNTMPHGSAFLEGHAVDDIVLRVFTPDTRRRIFDLTHERGGLIQHLLWHYDDLHVDREKGTVDVRLLPEPWNYEAFQTNRKYAMNFSHRVDNWVPISKAIDRYEEIVSSLKTCSKEMSDFIQTHINLEDVVLYQSKRD